jgi:hypothetical protein
MIFAQTAMAIVAAVVCMIALGIILGITSLFLGHSVNEHGLFFLLFPMAGISWLASYGRDETFAPVEVAVIFAFIAVAMVLSNVAGAIWLVILVAAYVAIYGLPVARGSHYVFVRRPIEQAALKQQTLSSKLDVDAELAEATLRHERARAALADADRFVAVAERRAGPRAQS